VTSTFSFDTPDGSSREIAINQLVIAGWTARDRAAVDHHIAELAAIGVPPPSTVPLFYRVSADLLTQGERVEVLGPDSSGEVEPVLIDDGDQLWLGLGSDHTDRKLESHSVAFSKQACLKPVGNAIWALADLHDHLDELVLTSFIRDDESDEWVVYQQGKLAKIRPLLELTAACPLGEGDRLGKGTAMMCGTLGAIGGVRPARHFRMELHDPVRGRTLTHSYESSILPVIA
jgi:hypothetical protein